MNFLGIVYDRSLDIRC